jgi:hypothetical protein
MVTAGRMYDHTWRFANNQKVFILKKDCEIDLLGDELMGLGWKKNDRDCIIFPQTLASFHPLTVDQNIARVDQSSERGTGVLRVFTGQKMIEPLSGFVAFNGQESMRFNRLCNFRFH